MSGVGGDEAISPQAGDQDSSKVRITDIYHDIFSSDPLLIEPESQSRYSRALLKHLLISRSLSATRNEPIDLRNRKKRSEFLARPVNDPPPPSADTAREYLGTRRNRTKVSKALFDSLKSVTLVADGGLTSNRKRRERPLVGENDSSSGRRPYADHGTALGALPEKTTKSPISKRLRIATIGYRVRISLVPNKAYFGEELAVLAEPRAARVDGLPEPSRIAEVGRTQLIGDRNAWETRVRHYIKQALSREPHLIVLPEFALPPRDNGPLAEVSSDEEEALSEFHAMLRGVCTDNGGDHFLFAGSRHEGPYNRGLILSKLGTEMCHGWWHYKNAPAKGMGENILARYGRKSPTYVMNTIIAGLHVTLAIMVAICYDAFDPSTFLNLILQSRQTSQEIFSVILVPSFNTSEDFVALLRDLSFLARCIVVYVNGLHGNARVYAYGVAMTDLVDHLELIKEKANTKYTEVVASIAADVARVSEAPNKGEEAVPDKRFSGWTTMRTALKALLKDLDDWESTKAREHLITVEGEHPVPAVGDDYAPEDILYYNIDLAMLSGLAQFRSAFFLNDKFLPDAFHENTITEALEQLRLRQHSL